MLKRGEDLGSSNRSAPTYPFAASASFAGSSSTSLRAFSWTLRPLSVRSVQGENSTAAATRLRVAQIGERCEGETAAGRIAGNRNPWIDGEQPRRGNRLGPPLTKGAHTCIYILYANRGF